MKTLLASVVAVGFAILSCASAFGQQGPAAGAPAAPAYGANAGRFGVAVVDISYVFKSYPRFTTQIDMLKKEMEAADGQLKAEVERLKAMEQKRDTLKPGSVEFKQIDEELARQKADFQIKQGTIRRDFLEREAKVYFGTYQDVSTAVRTIAQQGNIGMVLRFNGDPIDAQQREDVMRAITQPIVFQNNVDITPDVLALLNRGVGGAASATRPTGTTQQ